MYLFVSYNPRATCCSMLHGGYSLDSFKSNVINTSHRRCMWMWCLDLVTVNYFT